MQKKNQSTFDYLPKETKQHLIDAEYDPETTNQFLSIVKEQNDKYLRKSEEIADIKKVFEPHKDALAEAGITEAQQVQAYVQWHQGILNNPKEGMIQLASSLGFDPS